MNDKLIEAYSPLYAFNRAIQLEKEHAYWL